MSALLQFANYVEHQPQGTVAGQPLFPEAMSTSQPCATKKPSIAVRLHQIPDWRTTKQELPPARGAGKLEEIYVFDDRPAVLRFIAAHHVETLLLDAQEALDNAFDARTLKSLSVIRDDEGFETLFCLIMTPFKLDIAERALRDFDERWWVARSAEGLGKLNFDFELV